MQEYDFEEAFGGIPSFLKPRLRIFMSVDVIGSTAIKQKAFSVPQASADTDDYAAPHDSWLRELSLFYGEFNRIFYEEWSRSVRELDGVDVPCIGKTPQIWKTNGDEIIITKRIDDRVEIKFVLAAWIRAIARYRAEAKATLDIKGTAWVAGFPITNSEFVMDRSDDNALSIAHDDWKVQAYHLLNRWYENTPDRPNLIKDYLGPSIDTGFRLSSFATRRRLPVSIELAWLISSQAKDPSTHYDEHLRLPQFLFLGEHGMKGVFGGQPYPVFAFDLNENDPLSRAFDSISSGTPTPLYNEQAFVFCEEFFKRHLQYFMRPFIAAEGVKYGSTPTEQYILDVNALHSKFKAEVERYELEKEALSQKEKTGKEATPEELMKIFLKAIADFN